MNTVTKNMKKACNKVGGQRALARILGVSPVTVNAWMHGREPVPILRALKIEEAVREYGFRRYIRPNDWRDIWPELAERMNG